MNNKGDSTALYYVFIVIIVILFLVFAILKINTYASSEGARQKMIVNELVSISEALDAIHYNLYYVYYREDISKYSFSFSDNKVELFDHYRDEKNQSFQKGFSKFSQDTFLLNIFKNLDNKTLKVYPTDDKIYFMKSFNRLEMVDETKLNNLFDITDFGISFPSTHKLTNDFCFIFEGEERKLKERFSNDGCSDQKNEFDFYLKIIEDNTINNPIVTIDKNSPKEVLKLISCFMNSLKISTKKYYLDMKIDNLHLDKKAKFNLGQFEVRLPKGIEKEISNSDILNKMSICFNKR